MTSAELRRRAEAAGVAVSYRDWRQREVRVGGATLRAILDALGDTGDTGGDARPPGRAGHPGGNPAPRPAGPAPGGYPAAPRPPGRSWGFTVQLYSLRSRDSWGHGDLRDLASLAAWSGTELGAGFVLINPLHAAEPTAPVSASPYLPMSRRFISPLYLRVEDVPEYGGLPAEARARIAALAAPLRARNQASDLIDRDAVWLAKHAALEILHARPLTPERQADFERFRASAGQALEDWALWCALAEIHGPDWRGWPAGLRHIRSAATGAERDRLRARAGFHAWLQWLAEAQLAAAQRAARQAGMETGIITDLAVGTHPGGADAWAWRDLLVAGVSAGAPPDEFNQRGQSWGQPPWHPLRLAEAGYQPLADLMAGALGHAGGLRIDHVMGLFRLWWVPAGMPPERGTYVRYDHQAMVGVLTSQAARAGALAIGEDLGTVDPSIREYLAARRVLGTSMLWFERGPGGAPRPPGQWRRDCLATVGTHDIPPAAAFVTGEQVTLRASLGLLTRPEDAERADAAAALTGWRDALAAEGLIPPGAQPGPVEFTAALYGYLARTPAALIGVSLADAVGDRRPQNMPGTTAEYPNWRIPLCGSAGDPVLLEDLAGSPAVRAVVAGPRAAAASGPRPGERAGTG